MKNPLHYQLSEYDCGPTTMLNAINYLFEREEISPEVIRNIMLYCLDCYGTGGTPGKSGTSRVAMMFLSNWLNGYGQTGQLSVSSQYLSGENVYLGDSGLIYDALHRGGVVVIRLFYEGEHYVLLTGEENGCVKVFDPYYREKEFTEPGISLIKTKPFTYNRIIAQECFDREGTELYALGEVEEREAVLLFNEETKLTEDKTIEYFI